MNWRLFCWIRTKFALRAGMPSLNLQSNEARAIAAYLLRDQFTEDETAPGAGVGFAFYRGKFPSAADMAKAKPEVESQLADIDLAKALALVPDNPPNSDFGVRFFGLLDAPADGTYRFWAKSDDGTILTINGKQVINNDGHHPPTEKEGSIELRKGPPRVRGWPLCKAAAVLN